MRSVPFKVAVPSLVIATFLAACNGCGGSDAERTAVKPAPTGGEAVSSTAIDEEKEEPEVGDEGVSVPTLGPAPEPGE